MESFRFPSIPFKPGRVPTRDELRAFYDEIQTTEGRLYFLLYATSGLRRREGLSLRPEDVDEGMRMVTPNKGLGGTKNTWVTFYNKEMEGPLEDYTPLGRERGGSPSASKTSGILGRNLQKKRESKLLRRY